MWRVRPFVDVRIIRGLVSIVNFHRAISACDSLVVGGREVWVVGSSGCWAYNDSAGDMLGGTARLVNGICCLLCHATWALYLPD